MHADLLELAANLFAICEIYIHKYIVYTQIIIRKKLRTNQIPNTNANTIHIHMQANIYTSQRHAHFLIFCGLKGLKKDFCFLISGKHRICN